MAIRPRPKTTKQRFRLRLGKKTYDFLVDAAKVAGVISLIYGVAFGVFQFYETKKEKRIEELLQLFRQFNNPPFTDYRRHINIAIIDNRQEIANAAADEKQLTAAIISMVQKAKLETDLAFVFNFFDTVVYCAAKNICDLDIVLDLFYPSARELYVPFYQYIQAQQNTFNDFGVGVETLVRLKKSTAANQTAASDAAK